MSSRRKFERTVFKRHGKLSFKLWRKQKRAAERERKRVEQLNRYYGGNVLFGVDMATDPSHTVYTVCGLS